MALMAPVEDGKIVTTESQNSLKKNNATGMQSGMDKDAFLQLLVAQMQYQDPLEPTSIRNIFPSMHNFPRWSRCRIWRPAAIWREQALW